MRLNFKFLPVAFIALVAGIFLLNGCGDKVCTSLSASDPSCQVGGGDGGQTPSTVALVYYANSTSVQGASLNDAGTFANIASFSAPTLPSNVVNSMVIVNKQFLYVPIGGVGQIQAFSINHTSGALTAVANSPFTEPSGDDVVTTDPAGKFLFVGGQFSPSISVYQIDSSTGALTPVAGSPFSSRLGGLAASLTVDSSGKFLYVGQGNASSPVSVFTIDSTTGALTETAASPYSLGVGVVQADPSANFLLGIASGTGSSTDAHVYVFSIDPATGAPTAISGSPFSTTAFPFALQIHPSGKFVYVSVADGNGAIASLEALQINSTSGALTAVQGSPFTSLPALANCQFVQTGTSAFCDSETGLTVLSVNTTTGVPQAGSSLTLTTTGLTPFAVTN